MHRQRIHTYKHLVVTTDVAEALRKLETAAAERGWQVRFPKQEPAKVYNPLSLVPAGREVQFSFIREGASEQDALNAAWACAIPLGFTPKNRYPLVESGSQVYHFFGPWQDVYHRLLAEGRGHLGWPSLCCAAQVDVGVWQGDKDEARFVQAQLHRIGRNPGPVDGVVGQRTAAAIESLNLPRGSLTLVAEHLRTAEPPKNPAKVIRGHLLLPGQNLVVRGYGGVKAWPAPNGSGFEVDGPGRIVVDVR